jgi:hypothetical protein
MRERMQEIIELKGQSIGVIGRLKLPLTEIGKNGEGKYQKLSLGHTSVEMASCVKSGAQGASLS